MPGNRILFSLLCFAVILTITVFGWLVSHLHTRSEVAAIIIVFAGSAWAWAAAIYYLQKSRKTLLRHNAERKRIAAALKKSEAQFRELFENANDIVFTTDLVGYFTSFNKEAEAVTGYSRLEAARLKVEDVIAPEHLDLAERVRAEKLEKNTFTKYEADIITKNGDRLTVEINSRIIYEGEKPVGIQGIARDITDRLQMTEALRKSEQYENLFKHANDAILVIEPENETVLNVNDRACELYGIRSEEFIGRSLKTIVANPEDDKRKLSKLLETGVFQEFETIQHRSDGVTLHLIVNASLIEYEGRRAILCINRDITNRKRTEHALLRSQSALNATEDGVYMFSPDTLQFFYVNKGAVNQTGYSRAELLRMTPLDIKSNLTERRLRRILGQLTDGELESYSLTSFFKRKDGTNLPVEIILQYVASETGENLFVAMVRDITERKQAQDALQKNLSLLTSMFEATPEGVLVVGLDDNIVTYNRKFLEIFEIPEEIVATGDTKKAINYVFGQLSNAEEFAANTRKLVANPETKSYDLLKFKNGRIYERYNHPQTENGKVVGRVVSFRDITEARRAEEELQESQQRYRQLFESNPYPIWVYDVETLKILAVNQESTRHYGYSHEEFLALTIKDVRPPEDIPMLLERVAKAASAGEIINTSRHLKKDGELIEVEVASQSITFAGRTARLALITDITKRKRAEAALRESEYKLRTLLGSMNEGLCQVTNDQVIEFVNERFCEMTGYGREELLGKATYEVFLDEESNKIVEEANKKRVKGVASQYELRLRKKSGEALWVIVGGAPIINAEGVLTGSMGVFTDITERKLAEERLLHDALHDNLTGLANRKLFTSYLQKTIERGKRGNQSLYAVLFLDFDRFKVINDSLGHAAGDSLLKQIARRLESSLRDGDLLARLGGDEFTILLSELAETHDAVQVAERIKNDLNTPFMVGEQEIFISASIGITLCGAGHQRAEDMLRDADIAMYRAKAKGKAQHQIFEKTMHKSAINKLQLETEMHHALQRGEFSLNYQPIVDIETNKLMGFEALIRWVHPERGMILPSDFIPIAEENELVLPLGRWILYESCRQLREWQHNNPWASCLSVSVNLSSKQFLQFDLYEQVAAALISTQLDPRCLKLEITESHVMENSDKAVSVMQRLRETGVEISLDDFGTGYSSLSYLHRLPVNYLKIDRSFVSRMVESRENGEIVRTIVKLAQNLKMKVIAEGIENYEQFSQLKQLGCEYGQGYFISQPLKSENVTEFISRQIEDTTIIVEQPLVGAELNV